MTATEEFSLPDNALTGKTFLITGAAGGLGSALSISAAEYGAELILLDKNQRGLNTLHDRIEQATSRQPGLYPLDLAGATADDYQTLTQVIKSEFDNFCGVIHCAATLGQVTPFSGITSQHWQQTFNVNVHGPVLLTQALLPALQESGQGRIVFSLDKKVTAYWGAYASSKAALHSVVSVLSDELDAARMADDRLPVTCNAINPGPMRTTLRSSAYPGENPAGNPDPQTCVGRYLYLLTDAAGKINGRFFNATL